MTPATGRELAAALRAALAGRDAWIVGGAVRDELLGRETLDVDVAVASDPRGAAQALRSSTSALAAFELSDAFGAWRVIGPGHSWQVDLVLLQGGSLEADLAARDLTVNAIARSLEQGTLVDPHGGRRDLAQRQLRMVSAGAFAADPLRVLRVARLAVQLGFEVEPATAQTARAAASGLGAVAGERVFAELRQTVEHDEALRGLTLADELGAISAVLPELVALRGVEQSDYHHLDVHDHTLAVLEQAIELQREPEALFGAGLGAGVRDVLAEPLADDLTRGGALRWGALLHDIAKPQTRTEQDGRVGFQGHDAAGADLARTMLARLRVSARLRDHVAALARHHLRLGFLVHEAPLSRRGAYRYLAACAPVAIDVTLLSVADRLATRGRNADLAIARHMQLARELLEAGFEQRSLAAQPPLVRGDELAQALAIEQGPRLGELLGAIEEARFAGEVATREDALRLARSALEGPRT